MKPDPFNPIANAAPQKKRRKVRSRNCIMPVPANAPARPLTHPKLGRPSMMWTYRDADGQVLGYVDRYEMADHGKTFRPLALFELDGKYIWRWESWPTPRPLYGLDRLAGRPDAPVVVCEGEKAADAAHTLLPGHVAVTSPGGSQSAAKAEWSALAGRSVLIWPDADAAGNGYVDAVEHCVREAGANSVLVLRPPDGVSRGWDARDALNEGWTEERLAALIEAAEPRFVTKTSGIAGFEDDGAAGQGEAARGSARPKTLRGSDALIAAGEEAVLWHSNEMRAYATIMVNGHAENWPLESVDFKRWLAGRYYHSTARAPTSQQLADALRVLEVKAIMEGACHQPAMRTGATKDALWIDLCDGTWRAIKITPDGWRVVAQPDVKFVRSEIMAPLPEPEPGHMIEELRGFINADDDDFILIVAWLVAALWGRATTYPVLALSGEQGSGKSTVSRLLRSLVDPSAVETAAPPRDERDLVAAAAAQHVLAFDNISKVDGPLADAICRLSTGAGTLARKLHTNAEISWFQAARPIIINGIPSLTDRADLAERSLTVRLRPIDEDNRQPEDEWWAAWEAARPGVLAALCDALSGAMRRFATTKPKRLPRMASFAKLSYAAAPSLGWQEDDFERAYARNRAATSEAAFEGDIVAVAVFNWIHSDHPSGWEGTATQLLAELNMIVPDEIRRSHFWPTKANALGNAIERAAPLLRQKGIQVTKKHTGAARIISIMPSHQH